MTDKIIKAYMTLRGISQRELAEIVGITVTTLNHKINGKASFNRDEMEIIAKTLGVSVEELFFTNSISKMKINGEKLA